MIRRKVSKNKNKDGKGIIIDKEVERCRNEEDKASRREYL